MTELYTRAQLFAQLKTAGFNDKDAEVGAAIGLTESTAVTAAGTVVSDADLVGDVSIQTAIWGCSYGSWQIRSLKAEYGKNTYRDAMWLPFPANNARAVRTIFLQSGWTPWSTYTSGAYKGNMQDAVFNPKPAVPAGCWMVSSGESLSVIADKSRLKYPPPAGEPWSWQLLSMLNRVTAPRYLIYPGQVIKLPDWVYTVVSGDTLTKIATNYSEVSPARIAEYSAISNPDVISVGQKIHIPRYTSWDGRTLTL